MFATIHTIKVVINIIKINTIITAFKMTPEIWILSAKNKLKTGKGAGMVQQHPA